MREQLFFYAQWSYIPKPGRTRCDVHQVLLNGFLTRFILQYFYSGLQPDYIQF